MAVIDASVYVALFDRDDPEHRACQSWFSAAAKAGDLVLAPCLILSEVAAAVSRGRNDAVLAARIVSLLENSAIVRLVPVSCELASRAARIAADQRIRGADAIYVALAQQVDDKLVTLDRQQLQRGAAVVVTQRP